MQRAGSCRPVCFSGSGAVTSRRGGRAPGAARGGARPLLALRRRVLARLRREARLSRSLRAGAHRGRLALGADPRGLRRFGPGRDRGLRHPRGGESLRGQFGCLPRADVRHGHGAAARLGGAEAPLPARHRGGQAAPAVLRRDRAHHRLGHHEAEDRRGAQGRPLRRQRPEGLDLARAALRPHAAARAHHAARPGEEEVRRPVRVPRRPARERRPRHDRPPDPQHAEPRDQRGVLRRPRSAGREPGRRGGPGLPLHPRRHERRAHPDRRRVRRRRPLVHRARGEVRDRARRVRPADRPQPGRAVPDRPGTRQRARRPT